jgi:hypothetical protein
VRVAAVMAVPRASEECNYVGNHGHGGGAVIIQGMAAARVFAVVVALWDSKCASC